jgi:hypothetical protein
VMSKPAMGTTFWAYIPRRPRPTPTAEAADSAGMSAIQADNVIRIRRLESA